ncbi:prepilin peptidase-dependent protein [Kosakonia sp. SMBL-WEM22]|uniref:prepilin peptidase-dependent protein n=1 Tax=Kosakonia sp. SMBL-WEM22 TaxID=2725560 RepID=UPI001658CCCC|nr:prepilin peptidase-dependent protein [Kosakonia sp. SMBL-WEM22]QNQ21741.1 prepilin peptidase-dependent protein [Kosakonia sp. SMBL-WEM22]
MLNNQRGFSLLETLLAMAIGSVLLLASARFLPALQIALMQHTQLQTIEDDLWQRLRAVAKHLQRAGYCNGSCNGQPLFISAKRECFIAQWDANSNGRWEGAPSNEAEQTAFRLQNGALETLRGATSCVGRGWEKVTDPAQMRVDRFSVTQRQMAGFAPQLTVLLAASLPGMPEKAVSGELTVTGYNL